MIGPEGAGFDYTMKAANQVEARLQELRKDGLITRYIVGVPRFGNTQFNGGFGNANVAPDTGVTSLLERPQGHWSTTEIPSDHHQGATQCKGSS